VRVGVVGSDRGVGRVAEVASELPGVAPVLLPYETEEEAPELVRGALDRVDVLLFCGPVPHALAAPILPPALPATYIGYDGSGLVKALFDLHRLVGPQAAFSIDCIAPHDALVVVEEVGGDVAAVHPVHDGGELPPRDAVVARHLELVRAGVTRAAITYLRSVHRALEAEGVTTVYVEPLTSAVRVALRHAMLLGVSRSYEGSQLAVVLIRLPLAADGDVTRREKLALGVRSVVLDLATELEAASVQLEPGLHALYTTRDGLDRSPGWTTRGLVGLDRLAQVAGGDAKAGIGFGATSREGEDNARRALELATRTDGSRTYVVLRDRAVLGPLGGGDAATLRPTRVVDDAMVARARSVGVSPGALATVYLTLGGAGVFDNERLASLLGVSTRSARRIASRLLAHGIAERAGEEQFHQRGRPRQLYRLAPVVPHPPETVATRPLDERSDST
jgi:hypothetical protein